MKHFDLRRIDLNLLVAFDALMSTRSVTRAAERLGLGQPAVSHALARLRELTGDSLFVTNRGGLVPTARALGLAGWVRSVLEEAHQKLLEPARFDPREWDAIVRLAMTPMMDMALMPRLLRHLAAHAPHVRVSVQAAAVWGGVLERLDANEVDLYLGFAGETRSCHRRQTLWEEGVLALFSPRRLKLKSPMTLKDYLASAHVLVTQRGGVMERQVDDALARIGKERRIVLSTPHFLAVPHLLQEAPLIATLHGRAAKWLAKAFKLAATPLPIEVPRFEESMVWHEVLDRDPGQLWLREAVVSTARG